MQKVNGRKPIGCGKITCLKLNQRCGAKRSNLRIEKQNKLHFKVVIIVSRKTCIFRNN
jgi:hypothetical protein